MEGCFPSRSIVPNKTNLPGVRVPIPVESRDVGNDPSLFGRGLVRRLAGTFSTDNFFLAATAPQYRFWRRLSTSGSTASNECARGVFPSSDARSIRTVPACVHVFEFVAVSAVLFASWRVRRPPDSDLAAGYSFRLESCSDAKCNVFLDEGADSILRNVRHRVLSLGLEKK